MMADVLDFNDAPPQGDKPLDVAIRYAERGWPVFPCNPLTKTPLTEHGFKDASVTQLQIRAWWKRWPQAMIGVPTGRVTGFWVLDTDTDKSKGKDGIGSLAANGHDLNELMDTVVGITASGGYHSLFRWNEQRPVGVHQNRPWKHLDTRGEGGYIIAPGSVRGDGARYDWLNPPDENEIADAPNWLLDAYEAATRGVVTGQDPLDFNTAQRAPLTPAQRIQQVEPGAWHENTRDLIARMVREGASDATITALAPLFTLPGYSESQTVREFLTHAQTARQKWGYQPRDLQTEHEQHVDAQAQRFRIMSIAELINVKPPEWRIEGIFPTHGSSTLYGAYETYKTFIALDMTLCLATGRPWHGRDTKACSVLYIAGEGQVGLGIRAAGWLSANGVTEARFHALPEAVAIPSPGDQDALLRAIDAMPDRPEVIVLDTVTRMTGGGSLNDEKDVQAYVRGMDRLRIETGAHIMNVGHSGKDKEKGILGSTVLPGAMETIICVERRGAALTLINSNPKGKQKDGPNFEDINLRTQIVDFEHRGEALKTVVLVSDDGRQDDEEGADRPARSTVAKPQGANQQAVVAALKKAKGEPLGITRLAMMSGLENPRVAEATRALVAKGLVHEVGKEGARKWALA
jgi:hypothetical protein